MTPVMKPKIKNAIQTCFSKTGKKSLTFGDLKFLMLKEKLGKSPTKEKKKLYQEWKEKFYDPRRIKPNWEHPLKSYDFKTSYLAKVLNEMVKDKKLIKTIDGYSVFPSEYEKLNAIRSRDIINIEFYKPQTILSCNNINFYGIFPFKSQKIGKLIKQFDKIQKMFSELHTEQLEYYLQLGNKGIKKLKLKEKDRQLAIYFLKTRLSTPTNLDQWKKDFQSFEIIKKNGDHIIHYIPEDYYITNKQLINLLTNVTGAFVNFLTDSKPIVFTPKLTDKEKNNAYKMTDEFTEKL